MEAIQVSRDGGVVTITLDRPHRKNATVKATWDELAETFREITASRTDRVVVLTGAGGDFCSGADISDRSNPDAPRDHPTVSMRRMGDVCLALHRLPQPTIAKVRGVAVGAGCNMAFACDLVVAGSTARFSEIFSKRGLTIDFGGSWLLPRRIGLHKAKELALFGDMVDAAEAERIGLVNRVVDDAELDAFVDAWAARLAAGPPLAMANTKRLLDASMGLSLGEALDAESAAQALNFNTYDTMEAMLAFKEKRAPRFEGR